MESNTDDFALKLAVGVKDLYSKKLKDIEAQSNDLLKSSKKLQQGVSDISAFRDAEKATQKLSQEQTKLTKQNKTQTNEIKELEKAKKRLLKKQASNKDLTKDEAKALADLEIKLKNAEQSQTELTGQLKKTSDELKEQEREFKRLSRSLKAAEVDTKDLDNSLGKLENELKNVNNELKKTENTSKSLDLKEKLSLGAAGAAGSAAFALGAKNAYEWSKGVKILGSTTKLTQKQAAELKSELQNIHIGLNADPQQIFDVTKQIKQQTDLWGKDLSNAAHSVLSLEKFSQGNLDASEIIRAETQMQTAWKTSAATNSDLIATVYMKAGDRSGDLLDTFHEYSPLLAEIGVSAEQAAAMLINGAKAGAYTYDTVADTMKEARAQLTDADVWKKLIGDGKKQGDIDILLGAGSTEADKIKTTLAAFKQGLTSGDKKEQTGHFASLMVQLSTIYKKDAQKARNLIEGVFAAKGADDMPVKTLEAMAKALEDPTKTLGNYNGLLAKQLEEQKTSLDKLRKSGRELSMVFYNGFEGLSDTLGPVIDGVAWLADGTANFVKEYPFIGETVAMLSGGVAVIAAIGAGLSAIGFISIGATAGVAALSTGMATMGSVAAIAFGPIGLTIMGITAAGAILYNNWDELKGLAILMGGVAAVAFGPVGIAIGAVVAGSALLYNYWDELKGLAGDLWGVISAPLEFAFDFSPLSQFWYLGKKVYDWWKSVDFFGDDKQPKTEKEINPLNQGAGKTAKQLAIGATVATSLAAPVAAVDINQPPVNFPNHQSITLSAPDVTVSDPVIPGLMLNQPKAEIEDKAEQIKLGAAQVMAEQPTTPGVVVGQPVTNLPSQQSITLNAPNVTINDPVLSGLVLNQPETETPASVEQIMLGAPQVNSEQPTTPDFAIGPPDISLPDQQPIALNAPVVTVDDPANPELALNQPEAETSDTIDLLKRGVAQIVFDKLKIPEVNTNQSKTENPDVIERLKQGVTQIIFDKLKTPETTANQPALDLPTTLPPTQSDTLQGLIDRLGKIDISSIGSNSTDTKTITIGAPQISNAPVISITVANDANPADISDQVVAVLEAKSSDLVFAVENVIKEAISNYDYMD